MVTHVFADGCGEQNKGRKTFRNFSELSALLQVTILLNFACAVHFAGPWDTEGGRHHRAITVHLQNDRGDKDCESVLCVNSLETKNYDSEVKVELFNKKLNYIYDSQSVKLIYMTSCDKQEDFAPPQDAE